MADSITCEKLFEPARIGRMQVRNRIVMPAMATGYGAEDGYVTQQLKDYYEARAKGGAGLIIVEFTCVDFPRGKGLPGQLAADGDRFIPGLKELAQVIQRHGAKAALQLHHAGNAAKRAITQMETVGPSAVARPGGDVPRALAVSEIGDLVNRFADAAKRAETADFDGIEIHAAHAYLIAQFLSAAWNRRKDDYGGPLKNRARFLLEILQAIRDVLGPSYPVWCRINGEESGVTSGITLREARDLAKMLETSGADAINVSAGALELTSSRPYFFRQGWAAHMAAGVKEVVGIPVMAVGRIGFELAERLLQQGDADFIVMGRALRADPQLPNKLASGKLEDIRPCIACNDCGKISRSGGQRVCSLNAAIGREREYRIRPAAKRKEVLVVGGGPAGMEAARVAARRGHRVLLYEKGDRLGGQLLLAAIPPYKAEINKFTSFLTTQVEKLGVRVELNKPVTRALVEDLKPDAVILATGARPLIPEITGIDKRNVVTTWDVLSRAVEIGEHVAVVGGGALGCEVAAFLAEMGKKVFVVEMLERLASDLETRQGRKILLGSLAEKGVTCFTEMKAEEISDRGLLMTDKSGRKQTVDVDTIVLACGSIPNDDFSGKLSGLVPEIHVVGDCVQPRTLFEAIDEGARIGRMV